MYAASFQSSCLTLRKFNFKRNFYKTISHCRINHMIYFYDPFPPKPGTSCHQHTYNVEFYLPQFREIYFTPFGSAVKPIFTVTFHLSLGVCVVKQFVIGKGICQVGTVHKC